MTETLEDRALAAVCCSGQEVGPGLKELTIVPWGAVHSKKGEFIVDDEAARAMIAAFDAHGNTVPIDWEHEGLKGGRADAAGWVERLWAAPGVGLKALVKWTDKAREAIRSDAYRYLSPVLAIRKDNRRAVKLHSVGLTNLPAIPAMERVAASSRTPRETELSMMADDDNGQGNPNEAMVLVDKLRGLLGLAKNTSVTETLKATVAKLDALLSDDEGDEGTDKPVAQSVRGLLGLPAGVGKSAVVLAMRMADTSGGRAELVAMRQAESERIATEHVNRYVKDFKLNVNDKDAMGAALELARTNPTLLDQLMANAASVMPPQGKTTAPSRVDVGRTQVIVSASRDYRGDERMQKTCSMLAALNLALREAGMELLSEEEGREYIVA